MKFYEERFQARRLLAGLPSSGSVAFLLTATDIGANLEVLSDPSLCPLLPFDEVKLPTGANPFLCGGGAERLEGSGVSLTSRVEDEDAVGSGRGRMGMSSKTGVLPECPPLAFALPFPFEMFFFDNERDSSVFCMGAELSDG